MRPCLVWLVGALATSTAARAPAAAETGGAESPTVVTGGAETGRYLALLMWVSDYQDWQPLVAPQSDASALAEVLVARYGFARSDVTVLPDPTQAEMFSAIKRTVASAGGEDSLLIFFAGHGYLEEESGSGYWIPADGRAPGMAAELSYLSSTWVRDVVKRSAARHVAVVSDACFSGALLTSRAGRRVDDAYYARMLKRRSFEGLTSGAVETVADTGAPGGHSPFAYYLLQALREPERPVFDLTDVYQRVRHGVKHLSRQTPVLGLLTGTPGEGGSFVFVGTAESAPAPPVDGARDNFRGTDLSSRGKARQAAVYFGRACDAGHLRACRILGLRHVLGAGVRKSPVRARSLYERACDGGEPTGCRGLGWLYFQGEGVPADHARAAELYARACSAGDAESCFNLARCHEDGTGVARDRPRAAALYLEACRGGDAAACLNLAILHERGETVTADPRRAVVLFGMACELGETDACAFQGEALLFGLGVDAAPARARELFERACDGGLEAACAVVAEGAWADAMELSRTRRTDSGATDDPAAARARAQRGLLPKPIRRIKKSKKHRRSMQLHHELF